VSAALHHAAVRHLATTLARINQPDILTLHLDFLRMCTLDELDITVVDLKIGAATSNIQLQLSQQGKLKAIGVATSVNFEKPLGPSAPTGWKLFPPPPTPKPDFAKILAHEPEENWFPSRSYGELLQFTRRILTAGSRGGLTVDGMWETWNTFTDTESMNATDLVLLTDYLPSLSDTLLHNGGLYDANRFFAQVAEAQAKNPGPPTELTNTMADALQAKVFNSTLSLDIEFKARVPNGGLKWAFSRAQAKRLENGRMDVSITICDERLEPLVLAKQMILVLDAHRRFGPKKSSEPKPSL
jgi:hypothetical protein